MRKIIRTAFPKACRVIDRFHIQKLACDVRPELRIKHRWDAIQQANEEMEEAKQKKTRIMSHTDMLMVIPVGSCLYARGIYFSNQPINGQRGRNKGRQYYSKNTLTLKKHMVCAIPCG